MNIELLSKFLSRRVAAVPIGAAVLQYLISVGVPPHYATAFAAGVTVILIIALAWEDVTKAKAAGQKPDLATVASAVVQAAGEVEAGKLPDIAEIVALIKKEIESGAIKMPLAIPPPEKKPN